MGEVTYTNDDSSQVTLTDAEMVGDDGYGFVLEDKQVEGQTFSRFLTATAMSIRSAARAVAAAQSADQAQEAAATSAGTATDAAEAATQARDGILANAGFQAVATDLTGPDHIGAVASAIAAIDTAAANVTAIVAAPAAAQTAGEEADRARTEADRAAAAAAGVSVPVPTPADRWSALRQKADLSGLEYERFAMEPSPDPIALSAPEPGTGESSWTISGHPIGFPARVMVSGDLELSVDDGLTWGSEAVAANGVRVTVRPSATNLLDGATYAGTLEVGGESASYSFTYRDAYIERPVIVSPSDNQAEVGETPTLIASAYNILPGDAMDADHPHASTSWYVWELPGSTLVWSSVHDTVNKVQIKVPAGVLQPGTQYLVGMEYVSTTGLQAGAIHTHFTTAVAFSATVLSVPSMLRGGLGSTVSESGRRFVSADSYSGGASLHPVHGKQYFEVKRNAASLGDVVGLCTAQANLDNENAQTVNSFAWRIGYGDIYNFSATATVTGLPTGTAGEVYGVAVNTYLHKVWVRNPAGWLNGDPETGTGGYTYSETSALFAFVEDNTATSHSDMTVNFGHGAFAHTPPMGFEAGPNYKIVEGDIDEVFSSSIYTGTAAALSVPTNLPFDPSTEDALTWVKCRSASANHWLTDTVRGLTSQISTSSTAAAVSATNCVTAIGSGVVSISTDLGHNTDGNDYSLFAFKQRANFFKIATVSHTNGVASTVDLSSLGTVGMALVRNIDVIDDWRVWHKDLPAGKLLKLDSDAATTNTSVSISGTTLTIAAAQASGTHLVYAWAHDTGPGWRVKALSWTGDQNAWRYIDCAGDVQMAFVKNAGTGNMVWGMFDLVGGGITHGRNQRLDPSRPDVTDDGWSYVEPAPGGFCVNSYGSVNNLNDQIVALVFRRGPMYATDAPTQVYQGVTVMPSGRTEIAGVGFAADWIVQHDVSAASYRLTSGSLLSRKSLHTSGNSFGLNDVAAFTEAANPVFQITKTGLIVDTANGWDTDPQRLDLFKRMPGVFDIQVYRGTGVAGPRPHGLGASPELMVFRNLGGWSWNVYCAHVGPGQMAELNTDAKFFANTNFCPTAPTATEINLGTYDGQNGAGAYLALLFASKPGVSKVFSFTTDGSGNAAITGFGFAPRFIGMKLDSATDWFAWSAEMGMSRSTAPATEPYFAFNKTAAEITVGDYIDTTLDGFNLKGMPANTVGYGFAFA